jgi:hypothetical protein
MEIQTDYAVRFPKSDGGHIEYIYHYPGDNVTGVAIASPGVLTLGNIEDNLQAIDRWKASLSMLFSPVSNLAPDAQADSRLEVNVGNIRTRPKADGFRLDFTYDFNTKLVTADIRPAFNVSWSSFLFVMNELRIFIRACQGHWEYKLLN